MPLSTARRTSQRDINKLVNLNSSLGYLFKEAHAAYTNALRRKLKPYGITLAQWYFLRELWQQEGLTQSELSRRMAISEPTTATALRLMQDRGLIDRRQKKEDLRGLYIFLTAKGRSLRETVLANVLTVNDEASRGVSADTIGRIQAGVRQMIANLAAEERPGKRQLRPARRALKSRSQKELKSASRASNL
jgi:MarR family transcriptional regulator, organic hydroperoxide resistance regulator